MTPPFRRSGPIVATLCLLAASLGAGAKGPVVLFDGKSLDGWKKTEFSRDAEVKVDNGAIVMTTGGPMTGIVTTRKDLPTSDYELSYEASRLDGSDFFAAATFPVGKGFITLVNGGWGGNVTGLSSLDGADASENETTRGIAYRSKTWYRFRVRVTAEVIAVVLDGNDSFAVNYKDRRVGTRVETRECQPLGFATYETTGAVRQIEIRPLTPAEIAATNKLAP